MTRPLKCPICEKPVALRSENPSFPLCSPRCRAVDLGKWLGEEYRVPDAPADEREDEEPARGDRPGHDGEDGLDA